MRLFVLTSLLLGSQLLLVACAGTAPTFQVTGVRITQETDQGMVLEFTIEGANRREIDLPLREARYTLHLEGHKVFHGSRSPEATIQRYGTQRFRVPVALDFAAMSAKPEGQLSYRFKGTIYYLAPGSLSELLFETEIRRPHVTFVETGQLDFSAMLPESDQSSP